MSTAQVMLSNLQLARLVRAFLAEPGGTIQEKAALIGLGRNALMRASRGIVSIRARARLLAYFAPSALPGRGPAAAPTGRRPAKRRLTRARRRPGVGQAAVVP